LPHRKHVNAICRIEDYYAIRENESNRSLGLDGLDPLFIETTVLQRFENTYAKLLAHLKTQPELNLAVAFDIADVITQIKLRNPYHLEQTIKKHQAQWVQEAASGILADHPVFTILTESEKQRIDDMLLDYGQHPDYAKGIQLLSLLSRGYSGSSMNENIRGAMLNCCWQLLATSSNGPHFITSDNPGISIGADNKFYNTKFKNGFVFLFPLSYQCCLMISDAEMDYAYHSAQLTKRVRHRQADAMEVVQINNNLIQRVNKLLIANGDGYLHQIAELNRPIK
jgi:hypothetical protein